MADLVPMELGKDGMHVDVVVFHSQNRTSRGEWMESGRTQPYDAIEGIRTKNQDYVTTFIKL